MPEITIDRLYTLIGSAKANRDKAIEAKRKSDLAAAGQIGSYNGAIQVLEMLKADLEAQQMSDEAYSEYDNLAASRGTEGEQAEGGAEAAAPPASDKAMTLDELRAMMPENVSIAGVAVKEGYS